MKIGFACKYVQETSKGVVNVPELNMSTTTIIWLNRQPRALAEQKLWDLMTHNLLATRKLVEQVGKLPEILRMVRIGSDVLTAYTHSDYREFYKQPDVISFLQNHFFHIGNIARANNVRLSFHPGQFCCIVSDRPEVVDSSLEELEYHADMVRWMGFGLSKLDFKLNVHLSGKLGASGFDAAWNRMSPELRNTLTLENDEYQKGLGDLLVLKDKAGIVLDIHHHLIMTGEYISATDNRIKQVIDSWQGVRPVIHYSQSKEELLCKYTDMPMMDTLLLETNKSKLRAHSDMFNNTKINEWALTHLSWADIMCEAKSKNLASQQLLKQYEQTNSTVC
jgi:UV DNA damage repair endonuclease